MWNRLQHCSIFNLVFLSCEFLARKWCVVWWHSGRSEEFHLCYNVTNFHTISLRRKRKFRNERSQRRNFFLAQKWLLWLWPPYLWKVEICSRPQNLLLGNGGIFFVSQTPFFGCCCHNNLAECLECKYGYSTQKFHWYMVVVNRFLALSDKLCQS